MSKEIAWNNDWTVLIGNDCCYLRLMRDWWFCCLMFQMILSVSNSTMAWFHQSVSCAPVGIINEAISGKWNSWRCFSWCWVRHEASIHSERILSFFFEWRSMNELDWLLEEMVATVTDIKTNNHSNERQRLYSLRSVIQTSYDELLFWDGVL